MDEHRGQIETRPTNPTAPDIERLRAWLHAKIKALSFLELVTTIIALVVRMREINAELVRKLGQLRPTVASSTRASAFPGERLGLLARGTFAYADCHVSAPRDWIHHNALTPRRRRALRAAAWLVVVTAGTCLLATCAPRAARPAPQLWVKRAALLDGPIELSRGPGPAPRGHAFDPVTTNAACENCHIEESTEWRASLHRMAHSDPMVQYQLEREPFPFCVGCHAPESDAAPPVPAGVSDLGVGCVTCHVVDGRVLAAATPIASDSLKRAPHDLTRAAGFDAALGCGGCHEFAFPGADARGPLLMQSTMTEHAKPPFDGRSCGSCHMPLVRAGTGRAHRDHRFAASRDEALVRAAVLCDVTIDGGAIVVSMRPGDVGHAFPTGDMFRRIVLTIEAVDAGGATVARVEKIFTRVFGFVQSPFVAPRKVLVRDDRVGVGDGPVVFRYDPPIRPRGGTLRYRLQYERIVDPRLADDETAALEGGITLSEGAIALPRAPTE